MLISFLLRKVKINDSHMDIFIIFFLSIYSFLWIISIDVIFGVALIAFRVVLMHINDLVPFELFLMNVVFAIQEQV